LAVRPKAKVKSKLRVNFPDYVTGWICCVLLRIISC
jgi:hypothetical protein